MVPPPTCAVARKNIPSNANAIPTDEITKYFHTASSERRSCRWKMSGATARVVASSPTQSSPIWWLRTTSDAADRKASRQLTNRRPPRGFSTRR